MHARLRLGCILEKCAQIEHYRPEHVQCPYRNISIFCSRFSFVTVNPNGQPLQPVLTQTDPPVPILQILSPSFTKTASGRTFRGTGTKNDKQVLNARSITENFSTNRDRDRARSRTEVTLRCRAFVLCITQRNAVRGTA